MIKGSIQEEDITIVNIYAPNIGAPQCIRQMLTAIKREIDSNTIIVGDFNNPFSPMDRSTKMKINRKHKLFRSERLIDIYRTFLSKNTRIHFLLKLKLYQYLFRPHGYETRYHREKALKNIITWKLNNTLLNNQEITEEIKEEIKKYLETNDNENRTTQNIWDEAKAVLRGKFIAIQSHLKKQEKSQINNQTLHLKQLEKENKKHPKLAEGKES